VHSWVDRLRNEDRNSFFYAYTTSLHWSFTQFTPASMEVHPTNAIERAYAILCLLSGLVMFTSLISGITTAMTTLRQTKMAQTLQTEHVRRYLVARRVSVDLGNRIYNFLRVQGYVNKGNLVEKDMAALGRLSIPLLTDLHAELFCPAVVAHPFFHHLNLVDETGLVQVCHNTCSETAFVKGEHAFTFGQKAAAMSFVTHGDLVYAWNASPEVSELSRKDHICEAALWLCWTHCGDFESVDNSVLVSIKADNFAGIILSRTTAFSGCQRYAQQFGNLINTMACSIGNDGKPQGLSQISDMSGDFDATQEMAQIAFEQHMPLGNPTDSTASSLDYFAQFLQLVKRPHPGASVRSLSARLSASARSLSARSLA